jgi:hypothetical protein
LVALASTSIGILAKSVLDESLEAEIVGISSRGWFLRLRPHWILFLSRESQRGPLTVNVPELPFQEVEIPYPHPVHIRDGLILLPELDLEISTQNSHEWVPPAPPRPDDAVRVQSRLKELANLVLNIKQGAGLSYMLKDLLHLDVQLHDGNKNNAGEFDPLAAVEDLRCARWDELTRQSLKLLGRGPGLTPSGDDLVMGLLLALSRAQAFSKTRLDYTSFSENILEHVYLRTTTLSANLIECAARGLADERLITALDAVLAGSASIESASNCLCVWGNSSGGDVLLGMALTLTALYRL